MKVYFRRSTELPHSEANLQAVRLLAFMLSDEAYNATRDERLKQNMLIGHINPQPVIFKGLMGHWNITVVERGASSDDDVEKFIKDTHEVALIHRDTVRVLPARSVDSHPG